MGAYIRTLSFNELDFKEPPLRLPGDTEHTYAINFPTDYLPIRVMGTGPYKLQVDLAHDRHTAGALVLSMLDPYYQSTDRIVVSLVEVAMYIGTRPKAGCIRFLKERLSKWMYTEDLNEQFVDIFAEGLAKALKDMGFNIGLTGKKE